MRKHITILSCVACSMILSTPCLAALPSAGKNLIQPIKTTLIVSSTPDTSTTIKPIKLIDKGVPDLSLVTASGSKLLKPPIIFKPIPLPNITLPVYTVGPVISNIYAETGDNSLHLTWQTNTPATSRMEYGLTDIYGKTLEDKNLVTNHALTIAVAPGELHVKISSTDAIKKSSSSPDIILTIPVPEPEPSTITATSTESEKNENSALDADDQQISSSTGLTNEKIAIQDETNAKTSEQVLPEQQNGITAVDAVLGGLAVLFAGILIGILVRKKKE